MTSAPIPGWPVVIQAKPVIGGSADSRDLYEVWINHGPLIATLSAATIDGACALVSAALEDAADWPSTCLQSQVELALRRAGLLDADG